MNRGAEEITSIAPRDQFGTARALAARRHEIIIAEVRTRGSVRVSELAQLLSVSDMTVRRDLDTLDALGALEKVHGGATLCDERTTNEPGFEAKFARNLAEKTAIAHVCVQMVRPGTAIGLTAGTTTYRLATLLLDVADLTVVTNGMRIAEFFHQSPRADRTVLLTGGVRTPSDALVGPVAVQMLKSFHFDTVFMGVHGISERGGYTTPNMLEAETNRAYVAAAAHLVVIADHTKWNVTGLCTIAPLDRARTLVIDAQISKSAHQFLQGQVPNLVVVDSAEPSNQPQDLQMSKG